jgi:anti-sigma factor RsiW
MMSDACREMRAALGAAALGRADPAELLALNAHLDGCADCRAELRELTSVAEALPLADPSRIAGDSTRPPAELQAMVVHRVAGERTASRTRTRRRVAVAVATATAIAAAVVAVALVVPDHSPSGTKVVFASN